MRGNGCVPIYNLMEDAATAEICRAQVWQWVQPRRQTQRWPPSHSGNGAASDRREKEKLKDGESEAAEIFEQMMTSPHFAEFLTLGSL